MKIGMIGVGKLGLPCLLAMEKHGNHEVFAYDVSQKVLEDINNKSVKYFEIGVNDYLKNSKIQIVNSVFELMKIVDVIFIAVQTPHETSLEGTVPLGELRKDFSYEFLDSAIDELVDGFSRDPELNPIIVVISTVLPGTMKSKVLPKLSKVGKSDNFVYNPYFIAMGTTIYDFLNPEFLLIGVNKEESFQKLKQVYHFINCEFFPMDINSAELTKVAYNTFIGLKLIFTNSIMEICEKTSSNVDDVMNALQNANKRLTSKAYLNAGMGDGGGCHPRDQIAMSWLAKKTNLSSDIFEFVARTRDLQTQYLAQIIIEKNKNLKLPIYIFGESYKPNVPLTIGSAVKLLQYYLKIENINFEVYDPVVNSSSELPVEKCLVFIGMNHSIFKNIELASGSLVVDPWNHVESAGDGVTIYRVGRRS